MGASETMEPMSTAVKVQYQPDAEERATCRRVAAKLEMNAPRAKVIQNAGKPMIVADHPDEVIGTLRLMDAVGTDDYAFLSGLLRQLANAGSQGPQIQESGLNFMLAVVKGIEPRDQIEAMIASQMAAIQMAIMTQVCRYQHTQTTQQQDSAERALNKLCRTFTIQMEALKRYRTGGGQNVTVQNVSIRDGGQAIVGNVNHSPRETGSQSVEVSHLALPDPKSPLPVTDVEFSPIPAKRRSKK